MRKLNVGSAPASGPGAMPSLLCVLAIFLVPTAPVSTSAAKLGDGGVGAVPYPADRAAHSMVLWPQSDSNGAGLKMVLFGGELMPMCCRNTYYNDTWVFDVAAKAWSQPAISGAAPDPRAGHSAVLTAGQTMWVFGGNQGGPSQLHHNELRSQGQGRRASDGQPPLWALDLEKMAWSQPSTGGDPTAPRAVGVWGHSATVVGDLIYYYGGQGAGKATNGGPELVGFDTVQLVWRILPQANAPQFGRFGHSLTLVGVAPLPGPSPGPTPGPGPGPVPPPSPAPPAGAVAFHVAGATGLCLDVRSGSTSQGAAVELWGCNGLPNQAWVWVDSTLRPASAPGMCADAGNPAKQGNVMMIWGCNGSPQQQFGYEEKSETIFLTASAASATLCIDIPADNAVPGVQVELWGCNGQPQQQWKQTSVGERRGSALKLSPSAVVAPAAATPRRNNTTAVEGRQMLYMFGGWHEGLLADTRDLWAFDVAAAKWTCLCPGDPDSAGCTTTGDPPSFRSFHSAEWWPGTPTLVIAFGSGQNDLIELNTATLTWSRPFGEQPPDNAPPHRGAVKSVMLSKVQQPFHSGIWYFGGAFDYKANLGPTFNDFWEFTGSEWNCLSCGDATGCGSKFAPVWYKGCS